jgi:hypothetical protein
MSDAPSQTPRPVSPVAILAALAGFCLFLFLVRLAYVRNLPPPPQDLAAEKLTPDLAWKATPAARRANLDELRAKQAKQAASYAWIDQGKGIVQLPIDRAMELFVRDTRAKTAVPPAPASP